MRFLHVYIAVLILVVSSGKPHPGNNINPGREGGQFVVRGFRVVPVLRPAFVQLKRADPDPYYDDDDAEIVGRGFGSRKRYGSGYDGGYYGYGGYDDGYDGYGYGYGPLVPLGYVQGYGGYHHGYNQGYQGNHGGNNRRGGGTNGTNGTVVGNNNVNNVVVTTNVNNTVATAPAETTTTTAAPL